MFSNVIITLNNPKTELNTWCESVKQHFKSGCVQLEKGEEGTQHFQGCLSVGR